MFNEFLWKEWRFYCSEINDIYFCFDSFTHRIYIIEDSLKVLLENKNYREIRKRFPSFYKRVISNEEFVPKYPKCENCIVTINFSNNCNLNCKYCYRDKNEKASLSNHNLKEIMDYVTKKYYPNAAQYIFSVCYTSESSLDLEKLKYFDYLIGEYEGYLLNKKDVSQKNAKQLFLKFPVEIQNPYNCEEYNYNYLNIVNDILRKEKLWDFYDYSNIHYVVSALKQTEAPSYSKTIMINRQILDYVFLEYNLQRHIHYYSMSFMTNGTNISDEYISFLKSILMDSIYVSFDGPESIHNENRIYNNGNGTFKDTLTGINKLRAAGINVIPSVVITPKHPELYKIIHYFSSLDFSKISFNLARGNSSITIFKKDDIDILLNNIRLLFSEFVDNFINGIVSKELKMVKDTILFSYLKEIYYRAYITSRCTWGNNLVIDSSGNMYHCNSTIGCKEDYLGHYAENKRKNSIMKIPKIGKQEKCRHCYAKYLCGGTCYAEQIFGNRQNEDMECYFHKELINESFKLYVKLYKKSLLDKFMKSIV